MYPYIGHRIRIRIQWHPPIEIETCVLDGVLSLDNIGTSPYTPFIIYIPYILAAL